MNSHYRRINRDMLTGWTLIAIVLLGAYIAEVFKGERSVPYLLTFIPIVVIPLILVIIAYRKKPDWPKLCYFIVAGYFVMYTFVMLTCYTNIVFCYILPMLSLLVLYHHPKLILCTGIGALAINGFYILRGVLNGEYTTENSNVVEIQLAALILCFAGSYLAAKLYDDITKENEDYLNRLNTKNGQVRSMSFQVITTIANMLDAKDSYTEGHSQRVSAYSVQLAKGLGLSVEEIEVIRKIALLHDIGKIGVPDSVLNKPGRLTDEEFAIMRKHSTIGADIVKDITTIPNIYAGVRHHHERYDGKGYPDRLKGEEIPFIARIIAVADTYDAMTSNRVYRKHLTNEQAVAELERCSGTQFDPDIAHMMIELLNAGIIKNLSPDMEDAG